MRTRARRNAQSSQLHTESKNGRYVNDRFGHPPTDEHSWQNAAGRCWVGSDRSRDPLHSGYGGVFCSSHRAHPDLRSTRGDMPHCSPLWVYSRGTEARVTGETGALVMGTRLSLLKTVLSLHKGHITRAHCCARQATSFHFQKQGKLSETTNSSCT